MTGRRGFTLLEMVVATAIMGIAVTGLLSGIAGAARNAARLRDYGRVAQLAREQMNELLADQRLPRNVPISNNFDPALTGGLQCGWRALLTTAATSPVQQVGQLALDRLQLDIWWMSGSQRRNFAFESFRRRYMTAEDIHPAAAP